jgi:hypothetical protein
MVAVLLWKVWKYQDELQHASLCFWDHGLWPRVVCVLQRRNVELKTGNCGGELSELQNGSATMTRSTQTTRPAL